ncbi:MAG: hypothetical protein IPM16_21390 [Chloroflexi bacterium]|nr:hypothetical protein [Chloroflexota bacterium]
MEIMQGKRTVVLSANAFAARVNAYGAIHLDIGTGDGRYVVHHATKHPHRFVIGLDACRENLVDRSRNAPDNALFVIANAEQLPVMLHGMASSVTVNFPWGSLLDGLLDITSPVLDGIAAACLPGALVEVRLNGGALAEAGWSLKDGAQQVRDSLADAGFDMLRTVDLDAAALRGVSTSWAKRLAFGRNPHGIHLTGMAHARVRAAYARP